MSKKKFLAMLLAIVMVLTVVPMSACAEDTQSSVKITDCGHFIGADWAGEAGAYSVGWQYSNFNMEDITSIRVGAKDAKDRIVMEYTADAEQIAWQQDNGYVTANGLSSAPFYKEYEGAPIAEGRDDDWTAVKGAGFDLWQPALFYVEVKTADAVYYDEMAYAYAYPAVSITDCGHFDVDWAGEAGAYSLGWQYSNFNMEDITSIRVGAKDAKDRIVMEYTADAEQIAWQQDNGYVTAAGLSSAPFYKEYKGAPIAEGRDDDWTIAKGDGFNLWQPTLFYVEVEAAGAVYYEEMVYNFDYPHVHEVVHFEKIAPSCVAAGNIEYWFCEGCGVYFSDEALTTEISKEDTVLAATGHGETKLKDAKKATCTEKGYTGDKVCTVCGEVIEKGAVIEKLAHNYKDGKCTVCGAADPSQKPAKPNNAETPKTGDNSNMAIWFMLLLVSGAGMFGATAYNRKKNINK